MQCEFTQCRARTERVKHTPRSENAVVILIMAVLASITAIRKRTSSVGATRRANAVSTGSDSTAGINFRARKRAEQIVSHIQPRQTRAALHLEAIGGEAGQRHNLIVRQREYAELMQSLEILDNADLGMREEGVCMGRTNHG